MGYDVLCYENVVDGDDVDFVDALGFELVIGLGIARNLGVTGASESTGNADLRRYDELELS